MYTYLFLNISCLKPVIDSNTLCNWKYVNIIHCLRYNRHIFYFESPDMYI